MPTYEYECDKGHTFEVVQRITEDALTHCTRCKAKAHRLISASNFILKGSGWYSDGYSQPGSKKAASKSEGGKASSDSGSSKSEGGSSSSSSSDSSSSSSSGKSSSSD